LSKLWASYGQGLEWVNQSRKLDKNADSLSVNACGLEGAVSLG
jgi:hypothetical protein